MKGHGTVSRILEDDIVGEKPSAEVKSIEMPIVDILKSTLKKAMAKRAKKKAKRDTKKAIKTAKELINSGVAGKVEDQVQISQSDEEFEVEVPEPVWSRRKSRRQPVGGSLKRDFCGPLWYVLKSPQVHGLLLRYRGRSASGRATGTEGSSYNQARKKLHGLG